MEVLMKKNIKCPCTNYFSVDFDEEVDLDQNPSSLDEILNGTFMNFNCPACGKKHKPEFKISIVWKSKNIKLEVLPELERGEFYYKKKESQNSQTIIGFPEMADRLAVIKDDLEPIIIEALKSFLLVKAEENYPGRDIDVWYYAKGSFGIEFHLDGIRSGEVAVLRVPQEIYEKTVTDYKKYPKDELFSSLRVRSYLSVQNILRPDALK
jgi:hypothetical protein